MSYELLYRKFIHVLGCVLKAIYLINSLMHIIVGAPCIVRSDRGTENISIAACQMALRHHHRDDHSGPRSFIFGSSVANTVSILHYG